MNRSIEERDAAAETIRNVLSHHFLPVSPFYTLADVFADVELSSLFDPADEDVQAQVERALARLWVEARHRTDNDIHASHFVALAARLARIAGLDIRRCRLPVPDRVIVGGLFAAVNTLDITHSPLQSEVYDWVGLSDDDIDSGGVQNWDLQPLARRLDALSRESNRQAAGRAFQRLFMHLADLYDLDAHPAYRPPGEEIDGAMKVGGTIYLVETKWEAKPADLEDLGSFQGKVARKSPRTRGCAFRRTRSPVPAAPDHLFRPDSITPARRMRISRPGLQPLPLKALLQNDLGDRVLRNH